MRVMRGLILILVTWIISASAAQAGWVEAKSENFILVGDTSEKRAEKIVLELEKYRAIIFKLFNVEVQPEAVPLRIYALRSDGTVSDVTGSAGASGVYKVSREGPVFALNIKGGFTLKSQARSIAMHEYTHHLISQYTNQMYPRWVNEGMAEYLSTFSVSKKGEIKIGIPQKGRAYTLSQHKWMDMDRLVGAIRTYPYSNNGRTRTSTSQARFYAQSWLAVHYIQSTPGLTDKLSEYLKGIAVTENPQTYFAEVFEMTPDEFGKKLRMYFKRNSYAGHKVTLDESYNFPVTTRKLEKGEGEFHQGEAVRRFRRSEKGLELAEKYYTRAEKFDGPMAQIEASRALLAMTAGDEPTAILKAEKAYSLSPEDGRVLHVLGKVRLSQYANKETPSESAQIKEARKLFVQAMKANPLNLQAHYDYVTTYIETGDPASKQAIYSAKESTYYYRATGFIGQNLGLVALLANNDAKDFARFHLERAMLWGSKPSMRRYAAERLEVLEEMP